MDFFDVFCLIAISLIIVNGVMTFVAKKKEMKAIEKMVDILNENVNEKFLKPKYEYAKELQELILKYQKAIKRTEKRMDILDEIVQSCIKELKRAQKHRKRRRRK